MPGFFHRRLPLGLVTLAGALVIAACAGGGGTGTPTPISLGGGSRIDAFTPTPTAVTQPVATKAPTSTPARTSGGTATQPTSAPPSGNVEAGKQVFLQKGCIACHTIQGVPGAVGNIGPDLTNVASRAGSRRPGLDATAYLRQSLLEPTTFVMEGFQPLMPPGLVAAGPELDSLVAYLLTLR